MTEYIFRKKPNGFEALILEIAEETKEAYDDIYPQDIFEVKTAHMHYLAKMLFLYLIEKDLKSTSDFLEEWKFIMESGEVMYLRPDRKSDVEFLKDVKEYIQANRKKALNEMFSIALRVGYLFRIYDKPYQSPECAKRVRRNIRQIARLRNGESDKVKITGILAVEIKKYFDTHMAGQQHAKKVLAMTVANWVEKDIRYPILLEGPTGCGKTYIFELLRDFASLHLKLNFFSFSATNLTPNGYKGDNWSDIMERYEKIHSMHLDRKGIIFIDEMDKILGYTNFDSQSQDMNQTVIHQMLVAISGTCIGRVDTNNILFIFAGAFENFEDTREQESKRIGFCRKQALENKSRIYDLREEMIRYGVSRQFIGRLSKIVHMDPLSKENVRFILLNESDGILTMKKREFEYNLLELTWDDEFIDGCIDRVLEKRLGARGAIIIAEDLIGNDTEYEMLERGYTKAHLHVGMLNGEKPFFEEG